MHTARVACQTCHIPAFAKDEPTDMFRDWSDGHYDEEAGKHKPRIDLESNVVPVYAWFNGTSRAQLAGAPAKRIESGEVAMMLPEGSLADPRARIYPFKLHRAKLPALDGKEWIVPIITEHFYADGDIDKWVREAAKDYYGIENARFHWVDTIRYMSINHEVQPAKAALGCLDCHGPAGRMEWAALGYEADPLEALLDKTVRPNP